MAIGHANMILSWEENLAEDEMPPRWMWHLPWEIKAHMEKVVSDRKAKYERGADKTGDAAPQGDAWEADEADIAEWIAENTKGGVS